MLVEGTRVENGGIPFSILEKGNHKSVIQFSESGHRETVLNSTIHNAIRGTNRIRDVFQPDEYGFRKGVPLLNRKNDRKGRLMYKLATECWAVVRKRVKAGTHTCSETWKTFGSFEKWMHDVYADADLTGYESMFAFNHYSPTTACLIIPFYSEPYERNFGVKESGRFLSYYKGEKIASSGSREKVVAALEKAVRDDNTVPDQLRELLYKRLEEICQ